VADEEAAPVRRQWMTGKHIWCGGSGSSVVVAFGGGEWGNL